MKSVVQGWVRGRVGQNFWVFFNTRVCIPYTRHKQTLWKSYQFQFLSLWYRNTSNSSLKHKHTQSEEWGEQPCKDAILWGKKWKENKKSTVKSQVESLNVVPFISALRKPVFQSTALRENHATWDLSYVYATKIVLQSILSLSLHHNKNSIYHLHSLSECPWAKKRPCFPSYSPE